MTNNPDIGARLLTRPVIEEEAYLSYSKKQFFFSLTNIILNHDTNTLLQMRTENTNLHKEISLLIDHEVTNVFH